ncbi:N-acetylmuramoyl-L-alanine amidase [Arthrobacter sp. GAS37]
MRTDERQEHPAGKHLPPAPVSGRRRAGTRARRAEGSRRAGTAGQPQTSALKTWAQWVFAVCAAVPGSLGFRASGPRAAGRHLPHRVTGLVVACVLTAAALAPVDVAPANAAAALQALKARTLSAARDAAAANTLPVAEVRAEVQDDQGAKKGQDPLGTGTIRPGQEITVKADKAQASIGFSGHQVSSDLNVAVKELADGASRTAAAETGGTVLGTPVQVNATDPSGKGMTSFPADPVIAMHENAPATVTTVTPGVTLQLGVDASKLGKEPGQIDPATVKVMTRENPGDPWVALPSYFDPKTGTVKAESQHLSQFAVIGTPFVPPAGPTVVLDPDDDVANTTGPNGPMTELPESVKLANALAAMMTTTCKANVVVTRTTGSPAYLSRQTRDAIAAAANPDLTVTLAFDALYGHPWGVSTDGGTRVYSRGNADDNAVTGSLIGQMPGYTGRPANTASMSGTGTTLPYTDFAGLPGALVHMETLYLDHNYDRPVIDNGFDSITNGVFTGLGKYLQTKGFNCTNPVTGGWPTKPSAAELAKWRNLGFHNYQAYGAEPVSFATGNLIEQYKLFTLTGPGQGTDMSLVYNSQDGRLSRTGAGVSFGLGARAQRFSDGSVLVVQGDGASYVFTGNGAGGYTPDPGDPDTLTEAGAGKLALPPRRVRNGCSTPPASKASETWSPTPTGPGTPPPSPTPLPGHRPSSGRSRPSPTPPGKPSGPAPTLWAGSRPSPSPTAGSGPWPTTGQGTSPPSPTPPAASARSAMTARTGC